MEASGLSKIQIVP